MFEALVQGFLTVIRPDVLATICVAAIIGTVVGILPTLGGLGVMALLLVFIFTIPPEVGLLLLIAMAGVVETGGSMTSILLNIPGTAINAATVIDGFPMTQKGEASRAIGAALTASTFGGIASVVLALVMVPLIVPLVMALRIGDIAILILLGLTLLATLSSGSVLKGLIAGFLGIFCSLIGVYLPTGTERFAFGSVYLFDGLSIVPVVVGLFGVSAMIDVTIRGETTIARGVPRTRIRDFLVGAKDVLHHWWLWLRCTVIGYIIGVLPGVGGTIATFGAYGYAKQASKHPELFGTGYVEGVIAPESANNAKEGGALLTTLAFGLPGSASMAVLLAALIAVNVAPGRALLTNNLPLVFTLLIGIAVATVIAGIICFVGARWLIRIAYTPINLVFPLVIILIFIGTYAERITILGIVVTIIFGVLGLIMTRLDYSRPAFVLGFVLGSLFEDNLFLALKTSGPFFFTTPFSITLIILIIAMFSLPVLRRTFARLFQRGTKKP